MKAATFSWLQPAECIYIQTKPDVTWRWFQLKADTFSWYITSEHIYIQTKPDDSWRWIRLKADTFIYIRMKPDVITCLYSDEYIYIRLVSSAELTRITGRPAPISRRPGGRSGINKKNAGEAVIRPTHWHQFIPPRSASALMGMMQHQNKTKLIAWAPTNQNSISNRIASTYKCRVGY